MSSNSSSFDSNDQNNSKIIMEESNDDSSSEIENNLKRSAMKRYTTASHPARLKSFQTDKRKISHRFKEDELTKIKNESNDPLEENNNLKQSSKDTRISLTRRKTMDFRRNQRREVQTVTQRKRNNVMLLNNDMRRLSQLNELNMLLEENQMLEMKRYLYEKLCVIMAEDLFQDYKLIEPENMEEAYALEKKIKEEKPESYFLYATEMSSYEKAETVISDLRYFFPFYKKILYFLSALRFVSALSERIVRHKVFEFMTFIIILLNCFTIAIITSYEKNKGQDLEPFVGTARTLDIIFLVFYFIEMTLKIIAFGFALNKNSYMRDSWNFLDFVINFSTIIGYIFEDQKNLTSLQSLRAIRVLRPLRTISKIKSLRILLLSLFSAFPLLMDTFLILLFSFFFFGIAGLHLFSGILLNRCYYTASNGTKIFGDEICGNNNCEKTSEGVETICGKADINPNYNTMKFDNIFSSLLQVYQIVTLDKWTSIMYSIQKGYSNFTSIYFISVVIFGSFFLMNLTLAIIKVKFSYIHDNINKRKDLYKKKKNEFDLWILKLLGIWRKPKNGKRKNNQVNVCGVSISSIDRKSLSNLFQAYDQVKIKPRKPILSKTFSMKAPKGSIRSESLAKAITDVLNGNRKILIKDEKENLENQHFKRIYTILQRRDRKSEKNSSKKISIKFLKSTFRSDPYESTSEGEVIPKKRMNFVKILNRMTKNQKEEIFYESNFQIKYKVENYSGMDSKFFSIPINLPLSNMPTNIVRAMTSGTKNKKLSSVVPSIRNKDRRITSKKITNKSFINYEGAVKLMNEQDDEQIIQSQSIQTYKNVYQRIIERDKKTKIISLFNWSANDVIRNFNTSWKIRMNKVKLTLMKIYDTQKNPTTGYLTKINFLKTYSRKFMRNFFIQQIIMVLILISTIYMALEGYTEDEAEKKLTEYIAIIFFLEISVKIFGNGLKSLILFNIGFIKSKMNFIDLVAVAATILDVFVTEDDFKYIRFVKCFRILRLFRILMSLKFIEVLNRVFMKSLYAFINIALLLLIFIIVFALLGMQIFNKLPEDNKQRLIYNYDNFSNSFMTTFSIVTIENWIEFYILGVHSQAGSFLTATYIIIWIFIGNQVLLNLFLAILLDSFTFQVKESEIDKEEMKLLIDMDDEEVIPMQIRKSTNFDIVDLENYNHSLTPQKLSETKAAQRANTFFKINKDLSKVPCECSLFYFTKEMKIREFCVKIAKDKRFEDFILFMIVLVSVKLSVDTYISEKSDAYQITRALDIAINTVFIIEALIKIIAFGFIICPNSYLRDFWDQLDFIIILTTVIDMISTDIDIPVFKILRLLRPLRFLTKAVNIKIVFISLLESVSGILNVVLVILIFWLNFVYSGLSLLFLVFLFIEIECTTVILPQILM